MLLEAVNEGSHSLLFEVSEGQTLRYLGTLFPRDSSRMSSTFELSSI